MDAADESSRVQGADDDTLTGRTESPYASLLLTMFNGQLLLLVTFVVVSGTRVLSGLLLVVFLVVTAVGVSLDARWARRSGEGAPNRLGWSLVCLFVPVVGLYLYYRRRMATWWFLWGRAGMDPPPEDGG